MSALGPTAANDRQRRRWRRVPWIPLLLALLALLDLRTELQLLLDHFTWTSLSVIPWQHPLAVVVLVVQPSLISRYR